ncbi:MAG: hypothetical protein H6553_04640 [Chitinophagales bacterium]|nr:hypothetical protein [Chitinophagales bacterium]
MEVLHQNIKLSVLISAYFVISIQILLAKDDSLNLVPNGSFNQVENCYTDDETFEFINDWYIPNTASTDYFLKCRNKYGLSRTIPYSHKLGYQDCLDEDGYVGFLAYKSNMKHSPKDYREYLAVQLKEPLKKEKKYILSAYFNLADTSVYAVYPISFGFTNHRYYHPELILNYIPIDSLTGSVDVVDYFIEDKVNWVKCEKEYTAKGGEQYLIIGNFKPDCESQKKKVANYKTKNKEVLSYYFIDLVSIIEKKGIK